MTKLCQTDLSNGPTEAIVKKQGLPKAQLYDLDADPGERKILYESQPKLTKRLLGQLTDYVAIGSSVAGKDSSIDVDGIKLCKSGR